MSERKLISEMPVGQQFAFSHRPTGDDVVWQKTGTRAISRRDWATGEVLNVFYFTKNDFGYCIE